MVSHNSARNLAILVICLFAGIARLTNLDFLLQYFEIPDEKILASASIHISASEFFRPESYKYGSFPVYWSAAVFHIVYFLEWLFSSSHFPLSEYLPAQSTQEVSAGLYYCGRFTSVLFGTATVFILFHLAKLVFDEKVGYWSAIFLSLSPVHIFMSQLYKVDISLVLWILLTVYFSLKICGERKLKYYIYAGVFVGFSITTKYHFIACLPVAVAFLFSERFTFHSSMKLLLCGYVIFVVAFITCPFCFFDFLDLWQQLKVQSSVERFGFVNSEYPHLFKAGVQSLLSIFILFPMIFNPVLYVVSFAGAYLACRKDIVQAVIVLAFPASHFIFMESLISNIYYPHFFLPLSPFICLLAAYFFNKYVVPKGKIFVRFVLLLAILYGVLNIFFPVAYYRVHVSMYERLGGWIEENIPPGRKVLGYYGFFVPMNQIAYVKSDWIKFPKLFTFEGFQENQYDYVILEKYLMGSGEDDYSKLYLHLEEKKIKGYRKEIHFTSPIFEIFSWMVSRDKYDLVVYKRCDEREICDGEI